MKKVINKNFGWCPNEIINSDKLSLRAKGLWLYINSKPQAWEFSLSGIESQTNEGKFAIRSAANELEKYGLLKRVQNKSKDGKFQSYTYVLYDFSTVVQFPDDGFPDDGLSDDGFSHTSNKEQERKTKEKKRKTLNERRSDFIKSLSPYQKKYSKELLNEFYHYWTEHGENDKKMRFEKEKSFGVSRRLSTWKKKEEKWNPSVETELAKVPSRQRIV